MSTRRRSNLTLSRSPRRAHHRVPQRSARLFPAKAQRKTQAFSSPFPPLRLCEKNFFAPPATLLPQRRAPFLQSETLKLTFARVTMLRKHPHRSVLRTSETL